MANFDESVLQIRQTLTLFTSSIYLALAALVSSVCAPTVTRKFLKKLSMLVEDLIFCTGALLNAFANPIWILIVGRLPLGFGIHFSNQSIPLYLSEMAPVPIYLSEMAPYKYRGSLNIGFQLSITMGILAANLLNYKFDKLKCGMAWRLWSRELSQHFDTPNSMIERGKREEALLKLKRIHSVPNVEEEFRDIIVASEASNKIEDLWRKKVSFH